MGSFWKSKQMLCRAVGWAFSPVPLFCLSKGRQRNTSGTTSPAGHRFGVFWDKLSAKGHSKSAFFCTVVAVQSRSVSRSQGLYPHLGKSSSVPVSLCSLSALYPSSQEHHITHYALPEVFRQVKYGGIVDAVVLFRPRRDFGVAVVRAKT